MTPEQIAVARKWEDAKEALELAQKTERELRAQVIASNFDPAIRTGTQNADYENGWRLKLVKSLEYKCVADKLPAALDALKAATPDGQFIASRLIKYKPEVSVTEWKMLTPQQQAFFAEAVTIKDGSPQLSVEEAKKR